MHHFPEKKTLMGVRVAGLLQLYGVTYWNNMLPKMHPVQPSLAGEDQGLISNENKS